MTEQLPKVAVCGATGLQGGAVVKALQSLGGYHVRAITRNGDTDKARHLRSEGVEVVVADYDQPGTLSSAFQDCEYAFLVTNFWEHFDPKREYTQGCALMDAADTAGVGHVVWSTLEDTRNSKYHDDIPYIGDYKVAHFDEKAMISEYGGDKGFKLTNLYTSCYFENFITSMKIPEDKDGVRRLYLPIGNRPIPLVSVADIGRMAAHAIQASLYGEVGVASEHLTGQQITSRLSGATKANYQFVPISPDDYRNLGFPGCQELGNMFEFKSVHNGDFCYRRRLTDVIGYFTPDVFSDWCYQQRELLLQ